MLGRVRQASRMFQTLLLQACTAAAADPWSWDGAAATYLARSHAALSQGTCAMLSEAECHRMVSLCLWDPAGSTLPGKQLNSLLGYLARPGARELRGGRAPNGGGEGPDQRQVPGRLHAGLVLDQ